MAKSPPKPEGESNFAFFVTTVWEFLFGGQFPFADTDSVTWDKSNGTYKANAKLPRPGGSSDFPWQKPTKELDPTKAVPKNTFVFISPGNALANVGLIDVVTNVLTVARPGIWQALRDVPAKTGAGKYNVPTVPYPASPDDATMFWIRWAEVPFC